MTGRMLVHHGATSAYRQYWTCPHARRLFCALLAVAVIPSLLLNVGSGRALLIHGHDHEETHAHIIAAPAEGEHHHGPGERAGDYLTSAQGGGDSCLVILGNDLARPKNSTVVYAPAVMHALSELPLILLTFAIRPASYYVSRGVGAGPPNVSLASQTCVQILI